MFGRLIHHCCYSGCCNSCGNGCFSPFNPLAASSNSGTESIVCYCSRYVDVPMNIVYGEGYTEIDCCIDQNQILQDISDTLKSMNSRRCCGCGG